MNRVIIDTETAFDVYYINRKTGEKKPDFNTGLVYDFGGVVVDSNFNVIDSFNFVIDDVFNGMPEKMATAYYADKIPAYLVDIENGVREVVSMLDAYKFFQALCREYHITEVWAYNVKFDKTALSYTLSKLSNGFVSDILPAGVSFKCIMGAFKSVLANSSNYFKCAIECGQITPAGNVRMTAESAYQYISGNHGFIEAHTALADSEIEAAILQKCLKRKKAMDTKPQTVNHGNYYETQKRFKEWYC